MDYSRKRSAAVTVVAVLAILGSLFLLLCCAFVFFGMLVKLPSITSQFGGPTVAVAVDLPQKPACPRAISVLAWFYITSMLNLLFLPFLPFRVPIFVFGRVLQGSAGLTVLILSCLAFFLAGIGLLKLKPWSYSLTLGLQLFWLASTVVTVLSPNYNSAMDSFMKEMQATLHLPETQFSPANFSHHYGWTVLLAFLFAG